MRDGSRSTRPWAHLPPVAVCAPVSIVSIDPSSCASTQDRRSRARSPSTNYSRRAPDLSRTARTRSRARTHGRCTCRRACVRTCIGDAVQGGVTPERGNTRSHTPRAHVQHHRRRASSYASLRRCAATRERMRCTPRVCCCGDTGVHRNDLRVIVCSVRGSATTIAQLRTVQPATAGVRTIVL